MAYINQPGVTLPLECRVELGVGRSGRFAEGSGTGSPHVTSFQCRILRNFENSKFESVFLVPMKAHLSRRENRTCFT